MIKTAIAAALAAAAVTLAPVAHADLSCQGAKDWQVAHNNNAGNIDTSSQSAVDAYNSEADAIDAALAQSC